LYKDASCEHGLDHILRVVRNARIIGEKEGTDMQVLLPAAMLHDIALKRGSLAEANSRHALLGGQIAENILKLCGFSKGETGKICSAIRQHSVDSPTSERRTKEGDCLFDADKLDAITACGAARYLQEQALEKNRNPVEAAERFLKWLNEMEFRTRAGKNLGKDRSKAIEFCKDIARSGEI